MTTIKTVDGTPTVRSDRSAHSAVDHLSQYTREGVAVTVPIETMAMSLRVAYELPPEMAQEAVRKALERRLERLRAIGYTILDGIATRADEDFLSALTTVTMTAKAYVGPNAWSECDEQCNTDTFGWYGRERQR